MRVVRQIKGVESNKLQPIIRFHPDKDFRIPTYLTDYEPFNYKQLTTEEWVKKSDLKELNSKVSLFSLLK